jgi:hypothetical protein
MLDRLEWHRSRGHIIILISATSQLLVEPISHLLPVDDIICTRVETINHLPTGQITGIPAYREGKVQNLLHWLEKNSLTLEGSWAYSDSINDIPLLELVENSVAVTPDAALRKYAMLKGWRIMDLLSITVVYQFYNAHLIILNSLFILSKLNSQDHILIQSRTFSFPGSCARNFAFYFGEGCSMRLGIKAKLLLFGY